jgi:hypothetical protein
VVSTTLVVVQPAAKPTTRRENHGENREGRIVDTMEAARLTASPAGLFEEMNKEQLRRTPLAPSPVSIFAGCSSVT